MGSGQFGMVRDWLIRGHRAVWVKRGGNSRCGRM